MAKIAVLRVNGLGDLVFALPALDALRAAYREAQITLLAGEWQRALLTSRPSPVDRVIPVPPVPGVGAEPGEVFDPERVERFVDDMRAERFDLALQLHGGGRFSNPFLTRLGARVTAGLRSADAPPLDRWVAYVYHQPEVLRYLEVVALVGARPVGLEPRLAVTDADRAEAAAVVAPAHRLVAVHPCATDARRLWPVDRFAAVADELADAGAAIVVTGSAAERPLVTEVVRAMRRPAQELAGRVSLGGLAGVLERCDLMVGNDAGPLHLAAAVGTPTVGIFWASNMVNSAPLTRASHRPLATFRLHCPVCGLEQLETLCEHRVSYVTDVGQSEVLAACQDLLGDEVHDREALRHALDWRPREDP